MPGSRSVPCPGCLPHTAAKKTQLFTYLRPFYQNCYQTLWGVGAGLHKTGIRGIQDTRQIVTGKTNDKENNDKKVGSDFLT